MKQGEIWMADLNPVEEVNSGEFVLWSLSAEMP
jgi:hypothetical protein